MVLVLGRRGAAKIVPVREVSQFGDGQTLDLPGKPRVVHANLRGITTRLLLPGHGDPWTGGVPDAIRRARAAGRS